MEFELLTAASAERDFYGENLILLEGIIEEFLSCLGMMRRCQVSRGQRDPIASVQTRIKRADSMKKKLVRQGLPVTADSALGQVWDAAGVRLICPFVRDIGEALNLIRAIPGVRILREKDYIRNPKPNGYRSYHMILTLPLRFLGGEEHGPVWLEVQLRTIAMEFWANLEHQLRYKKNLPPEILIKTEAQLNECAQLSSVLDSKMQEVKDMIESHS